MSRDRASRWFLALLVAVAASRLALLPGAAWEQDEALFAAAAFSVDLVAHRPHPPGFPLWVGVGALGRVLLGDPLLALQLASALASVATVLLLARLWSAGLGDRRLGEAAAILFAFLPAVWFHAPRAFSTTPALALACAAGAAMLRPGRRGLLTGAAMLAAAVLVRPVLAPPLAAAALAATALRRDPARDRALAAAAGAAVTVAGFVPLVIATGGLQPFLASLGEHGATHAGALHLGSWSPARLGLVRALGGLVPAAVAGGVAVVGWASWRRREPRAAGWWLAVVAASVAWVLLAHNRTYPRYTLPVLALLVGPAVGGLRTLLGGPRRAVAAALAAAGLAAAWTAPAVWTQATEPFPPLTALAAADASPTARAVVVDGALSPFTDLRSLAGRGRLPAYWRPLLAVGRIPAERLPAPWVLVGATGTPIGWVPPAWPPPHPAGVGSARLEALAQDRFLEAWSAEGGALVLEPPGPRLDPDGALPLEGAIRLLAEEAPPGSVLGGVVAADGDGVLTVAPEGAAPQRVVLGAGETALAIPVAGPAGRPLDLRLGLEGEAPARLLRLWVDRPDRSPVPVRLAAAEQAAGLGGTVRGSGLHGVEPGLVAPGREGRWTGPSARLELPAACAAIEVELAAPRPSPAVVRMTCPETGYDAEIVVGPGPTVVRVPVSGPLARATLTFAVANPFVPAEADPSSADPRTLGVVIGELRRVPGSAVPSSAPQQSPG